MIPPTRFLGVMSSLSSSNKGVGVEVLRGWLFDPPVLCVLLLASVFIVIIYCYAWVQFRIGSNMVNFLLALLKMLLDEWDPGLSISSFHILLLWI